MSRSARAAAAFRTRYRLVLLALTAVVLVALAWTLFIAGDASPTAEDLECAQRYAEARSAADTARVDASFPEVRSRARGRAILTLSCGARRVSASP